MKPDPAIHKRLSVSLNDALHTYINNLNGQGCNGLYQTTMEAVEKQLITFSIQQSNGNISAAAKMLGISRTTLNRKIAAHRLQGK